MADLSRNALRGFARLGAKARLAELREEEAAIRRASPDLFRDRQPSTGGASGTRRRRRMSAAARMAVSERMRKYCTKPLRGSYFTHQLPAAA